MLLTAFSRTLHRVHDARIFILSFLTERHASQAGVRVVFAARRITWGDCDDLAVFDMGFEMTVRCAIEIATCVCIGDALIRVGG